MEPIRIEAKHFNAVFRVNTWEEFFPNAVGKTIEEFLSGTDGENSDFIVQPDATGQRIRVSLEALPTELRHRFYLEVLGRAYELFPKLPKAYGKAFQTLARGQKISQRWLNREEKLNLIKPGVISERATRKRWARFRLVVLMQAINRDEISSIPAYSGNLIIYVSLHLAKIDEMIKTPLTIDREENEQLQMDILRILSKA